MAAAMRRLAAASLTPRIPRILRPDRTSAAYSTWVPHPTQADPTPIYLRVVDKIEEMKTVPLTKDALRALQRAQEKAKTHHKFMHQHDIDRLPMKGLLRNDGERLLYYTVAVSFPSFLLLVDTIVVNISTKIKKHSHLEVGI
uniref:Uncharacterized protein n=1 Tax=Leersia perrieri TaxID=77586 RepID=A0A0D9VBN0_9ORYZ